MEQLIDAPIGRHLSKYYFPSTWGVPLAEDKTVEPVQILTFLGIEFDTLKMELRLTSEKISEINIMLELFMHFRKVTLEIYSETPLFTPCTICKKFNRIG
jgi:hypothetical protein